MKVQSSVKKTTLSVGLGVAACTLLMLAVFALLHAMSFKVLLGALLGMVAAVMNFFIMGLSVQRVTESIHGQPIKAGEIQRAGPKAAQEESDEDEMELDPPLTEEQQKEIKAAKKRMQRSYMGRLTMQLAVLAVAAFVPVLDLLATAIPLLFPGLVIKLMGIFHIGMDEGRS